jgi:predicted dehydrogenase
MEPVRFGIISTAKIGIQKVIPAMQQSARCRVLAIASRDLTRARAAAAALGIPRAYGSYAELLQDPEIEAIYNPLPNHLHVPISIEAGPRASTCCARSRSRSRPQRPKSSSRPVTMRAS